MVANRIFVALTLAACAVACRPSAQIPAATADTRTEAEAFMTAYARELRAHDREAIIARYDPRGCFSQGDGMNEF